MHATKTTINHKGILLDLIIYITIMFLIRKVYSENVHFLANGLFWSFTTLAVASWRMRARNVTWKEIGLRKPENIKKTLLVSIGILITTVVFIVGFNILKDSLAFFP